MDTDPPHFSHEDQAINNFVNLILNNTEMKHRAQLIIVSGIKLGDVELVKYATRVDPNVARQPIGAGIIEIIDSIFGPSMGKTMGEDSPC